MINGLLKPLGVNLCRAKSYELLSRHIDSKYKELIKEMEECFRELVFSELPPPCEHRTELMAKLLGTQISEAMYILVFLHRSLELDGDVCEFGVAQGATSALLANEIRTTQKNLWLFDSFKGLPKRNGKRYTYKRYFQFRNDSEIRRNYVLPH